MSIDANLQEIILKYAYGDNKHILNKIISPKLTDFINKNIPISFVMPAFPGKSPNDNSCFSYTPGKEEYCAIATIQEFQKEINNIYKPGCIFNIIPDGHYFHSLGITRSYTELNEYVNKMKERFSSNINFYSITDIFQTQDIETALSMFHERFINYDYKYNPDYLKNEILFLMNEFSDILFQHHHSKTQMQKVCKEIAKKSFLIKNGISQMIEHFFPQSIRLSIHYQNADSFKMGFKLIPQAINRGTPWFGILYITKNNCFIIGKKSWNIPKSLTADTNNHFYYSIDDLDTINNADIKIKTDIALGR